MNQMAMLHGDAQNRNPQAKSGKPKWYTVGSRRSVVACTCIKVGCVGKVVRGCHVIKRTSEWSKEVPH
jgi:hypothetical protein